LAVKIIRPDSRVGDVETQRQRFIKEAELSMSLTHPRVVQTRDFDFDPELGVMYMVMDLIEGTSLADVIDEARRADSPGAPPVDVARALRLTMQILDALGVAHAHGLVHRDLKPANIMVVDRGGIEDVVILDFGLARIMAPETDGRASRDDEPSRRLAEGLTTAGVVLGTPRYMSPEQACDRVLDGRSDLYSLGVILFEMLTGRLPNAGKTSKEVVHSRVTTPPIPLTKALPGYSFTPGVEVLVEYALSRDPDLRFADARTFAASAREALDELDAAPVVVSGGYGRFAAVSLAAVGVVAIAGLMLFPRESATLRPPGSATVAPSPTPPPPPEAPPRAAASPSREAVRPPEPAPPEPPRFVAAVDPPVPMTRLKVHSDPAGLTCYAGARVLGTTPLDLVDTLDPGTHSLRLADRNGFDSHWSVIISADEPTEFLADHAKATRAERLAFAKVEASRDPASELRGACSEYLAAFPEGSKRDVVDRLMTTATTRIREDFERAAKEAFLVLLRSLEADTDLTDQVRTVRAFIERFADSARGDDARSLLDTLVARQRRLEAHHRARSEVDAVLENDDVAAEERRSAVEAFVSSFPEPEFESSRRAVMQDLLLRPMPHSGEARLTSSSGSRTAIHTENPSSVTIHALPSGKRVRALNVDEDLTALAMDPSGESLAAATSSRTILHWSGSAGPVVVTRLPSKARSLLSVGSRRYVSVGEYGAILHDLSGPKPRARRLRVGRGLVAGTVNGSKDAIAVGSHRA
ncbi:MAG: protein kinase domain-containing protein, partial [Planctomycetota bacterium]